LVTSPPLPSRRSPDLSSARAEIGRNDRLGSLTHAVGAALYKGTDIDNDAVDRQCVRAKIYHDLTVKQNRQYPHCHVDKKGGKPRSEEHTSELQSRFDL